MTLNEIAYNILNLVRGGRSHHDEHISLEQIKFNVQYYRAIFIRRDYQRNGLVTRHLEQDLGCLNLVEVDAAKCCGMSVGCSVYRTEKEIPKTVRFNFEEAITFVGGVDGITNIPFVYSHMVPYLEYDKYTKDNPKAYMINNYLYVYEPGEIGLINVRGIFEDPRDLITYDCDGSRCYDDETEYPLPMDMLQGITQGISSGELQMLVVSPNDTTNDRMQDQAPAPPQGGGQQQG
tara:strand:+ start:184 stop:885 length:702 start_codon:yes stop_codon:yes gene_type:complete